MLSVLFSSFFRIPLQRDRSAGEGGGEMSYYMLCILYNTAERGRRFSLCHLSIHIDIKVWFLAWNRYLMYIYPLDM